MSVVDFQAFRDARHLLVTERDLSSQARHYGYDLTMTVTAAGVGAVLTDPYGWRVLQVEPQSTVEPVRDAVMCFLAAKELQS